MAPRPYWKGFLKLSLVSCPVALHPATDPAREQELGGIGDVDEINKGDLEAGSIDRLIRSDVFLWRANHSRFCR